MSFKYPRVATKSIVFQETFRSATFGKVADLKKPEAALRPGASFANFRAADAIGATEEGESQMRKTKRSGVTGRDGYVIATALAYAIEAIEALPEEWQEWSDLQDMKRLREALFSEQIRDLTAQSARRHLNRQPTGMGKLFAAEIAAAKEMAKAA
jgi:hypothetical protein